MPHVRSVLARIRRADSRLQHWLARIPALFLAMFSSHPLSTSPWCLSFLPWLSSQCPFLADWYSVYSGNQFPGFNYPLLDPPRFVAVCSWVVGSDEIGLISDWMELNRVGLGLTLASFEEQFTRAKADRLYLSARAMADEFVASNPSKMKKDRRFVIGIDTSKSTEYVVLTVRGPSQTLSTFARF
jgi:hypothetical protein